MLSTVHSAVSGVDDCTSKLLKLMEITGYIIYQINGQRVFRIPNSRVDYTLTKGCEVFVGKLPNDLFEDELVPIFISVGKIHKLRLMMNFSGTTRGYAFVQYSSVSEAKIAVKMLNGYEIREGHIINVSRSIDNCRLFMGGIPSNINQYELEEAIREQFENVKEIKLYSRHYNKSENRAFAFVEFHNHRDAALARRKCYPSKWKLRGQTISVNWALPEPEVDEDILSKVKVLYVSNLNSCISEEDLKQAFQKCCKASDIERVKKIKCFAFVHLKSRECAERIMKYWNKKTLSGSLIEIAWAKPKDKLIPIDNPYCKTISKMTHVSQPNANGSFAEVLTFEDNALPRRNITQFKLNHHPDSGQLSLVSQQKKGRNSIPETSNQTYCGTFKGKNNNSLTQMHQSEYNIWKSKHAYLAIQKGSGKACPPNQENNIKQHETDKYFKWESCIEETNK